MVCEPLQQMPPECPRLVLMRSGCLDGLTILSTSPRFVCPLRSRTETPGSHPHLCVIMRAFAGLLSDLVFLSKKPLVIHEFGDVGWIADFGFGYFGMILLFCNDFGSRMIPLFWDDYHQIKLGGPTLPPTVQTLPPPPPRLLEAPVRKIILQMHTPARSSQCWSRQTPHGLGGCAWMPLDNGTANSPVSGTADLRSSQTGQVIRGLR